MTKDKVYSLHNPENLPEWHWVNGLHDACIVCVETYDFPFDNDRFVREGNAYARNLMTLKIDASGALFDSKVNEIKLFNYKITTKDIDLQGRKKIWWLSDRLSVNDGHYFLEIDLQDFDSDPTDFTFAIKFGRAEVIRK